MGRDHTIIAPPPPPPAPRKPIPGKNDPVEKAKHRKVRLLRLFAHCADHRLKTLRSLFLFDVEGHSVVTWDHLQKVSVSFHSTAA